MSNVKPSNKKDFAYMVRKYLISAFVVASFAAYALHDKSSDPNAANASGALASPRTSAQSAQSAQSASVVTIYPTATNEAQTVAAAPAKANAAASIGPVAPTQPPAGKASAAQPTPTRPARPSPTAPPPPTPTDVPAATGYKDGQYTGKVADAYYGPLQVKVVIQQGRIVDVQFLDYPHDRRRSQSINDQVMPWLHDEAITAQSAQVDLVSGATLTSQAFVESLQSALVTAKAKA